ncbi:MAG TPA: iron-containing redox enzyme family protein [Nocardioidaceae bacterium]|nr:iron-containing redox enzyme family protein [Nocardioidaceae bacterium]
MSFIRTEDRTDALREKAFEISPLGSPSAELSEAATWLWEELAFVWLDFEERLAQVPVMSRIQSGTATVEDYQALLLNVRQQVVEGGRWIALASSSMSLPLFPIRSLLIQHAAEEHTDYQMLERNYVAAGGDLAVMLSQPKNIGSEAFSSYMFHQASTPDPLHLFGAMFIIEGLGSAKAAGWAKSVQQSTGLPDEAVTFLAYHGEADEDHYQKLVGVLSHPLIDRPLAERLTKTAKVVARLYALQLEELGNI